MILEPLPDDGAKYTCGITTSIEEVWDCPREAEGAMPAEMYQLVLEALRSPAWKRVHLRHRSLCRTHHEMIDRDIL